MPYHYGNPHAMGTVSIVPASDWAELLQWVQPVALPVTRGHYLTQAKPVRMNLKKTRFLVPATFGQDPCPRVTEQAAGVALVAVDADELTPDDAARIIGKAEELGLSCLIYHTASSTPERPRLRLLVDAEGVGTEEYRDAVLSLADLFGVPVVPPESQVLVQPMYFPVTFKGDDPFDDPILVARVGRPFRASDITGRAPEPAATPGENDLDWLRLPVDGLTINDAAACLGFIDPDLPYSEWLTVAAALRHQWPREPASSEAFGLFVEWSRKGSKFVSEEDCANKWESLKPHPRGRLPITARSLLHMAERGGWRPASTTEKLIAACKEWILAPARRMIDLTTYGAKKIASVPLISTVDRGILVQALIDRLALFSVKVTKSDVLADIAKLEARMRSHRSEIDPVAETEMPQWARGICYVSKLDLFRRRATGQSWVPRVFDSVHGAYLTAPGDAKPKQRPQDFCMNVLRIPRVDDQRYDPRSPDPYILDGARRLLNIYLPEYPAPDVRKITEAEELLRTHLGMLFAKTEHQRIVLDWMAYCVQHPGKKVRWAPLIQGAKGCGKTTVAEIMAAVLGRRNVFALDGGALMDTGWNEWCEAHQVIFMEEVRVVGESRTKVMNRLKPLVTNDWIMVSQRNVDARQIPNVANYLLLTNHQDAMPMTEDERRYCVLFCQAQSREQVAAIPEGYFKNLYRQIQENAGGIRAALENHPISEAFSPDGHAPLTEFQAVMGEYSASPVQAAIQEALAAGHKLVNNTFISLYHVLELSRGANSSVNPTTVATVLREMGYANHGRRVVGGHRTALWVRHGCPSPSDSFLTQAVKAQQKEEAEAILS